MNINWTSYDRTALNEWLQGDLGRKFLLYLESQRPDYPESVTDLTAMALSGAIAKGYTLAVREIEKMRYVEAAPLPPVKFVDVQKD